MLNFIIIQLSEWYLMGFSVMVGDEFNSKIMGSGSGSCTESGTGL